MTLAGVSVAAIAFSAGYLFANARAASTTAAGSAGQKAAPAAGHAPAAPVVAAVVAAPGNTSAEPLTAAVVVAAPASAPAAAKGAAKVVQKSVRTAEDVAEAERAEEEGLVDGDLPEGVELKLVILVRNDLGMSKGKIAAQVGHAVLGAFRIAQRIVPEYVNAWLFRAQAKITLKVDDEASMDAVAAAARAAGLPVCIIEDAGRTEVEPGTRTVCGIGPAPKAELDAITGPKGKFPLKLLT
jgi:PTH2 family peptidyl-tRNA hydrolase